MPKTFTEKVNSSTKSFSDRVKEIVRKIPKGKVLTYKEVAQKAGNGNASRAVGNIMKGNFDPKIPCHRVIKSDRTMGGYNRGGINKKIEILKKEDIRFNGQKVI